MPAHSAPTLKPPKPPKPRSTSAASAPRTRPRSRTTSRPSSSGGPRRRPTSQWRATPRRWGRATRWAGRGGGPRHLSQLAVVTQLHCFLLACALPKLLPTPRCPFPRQGRPRGAHPIPVSPPAGVCAGAGARARLTWAPGLQLASRGRTHPSPAATPPPPAQAAQQPQLHPARAGGGRRRRRGRLRHQQRVPRRQPPRQGPLGGAHRAGPRGRQAALQVRFSGGWGRGLAPGPGPILFELPQGRLCP
jgi:hypothetical protein